MGHGLLEIMGELVTHLFGRNPDMTSRRYRWSGRSEMLIARTTCVPWIQQAVCERTFESLRAVGVFLMVIMVAVGCIRQYDDFAGNSEIRVELTVLSTSCPGGTTAPDAPTFFRAWLVDLTEDSPSVVAVTEASDLSFRFRGVEGCEDLEVIVHGFGPERDGKEPPSFYGQVDGIRLNANETVKAQVLVTKFGGSTCINAPEGAKNVMFPTITHLPDGRFFVAGGFTEVARRIRAGSAVAAWGRRVVIAGGVGQLSSDLDSGFFDVPLHVEVLHPVRWCSDGSDLETCQ